MQSAHLVLQYIEEGDSIETAPSLDIQDKIPSRIRCLYGTLTRQLTGTDGPTPERGYDVMVLTSQNRGRSRDIPLPQSLKHLLIMPFPTPQLRNRYPSSERIAIPHLKESLSLTLTHLKTREKGIVAFYSPGF